MAKLRLLSRRVGRYSSVVEVANSLEASTDPGDANGCRESLLFAPLAPFACLAGQNFIVIRAIGGYKWLYNTNSKTHD